MSTSRPVQERQNKRRGLTRWRFNRLRRLVAVARDGFATNRQAMRIVQLKQALGVPV